MNKTIIAFMLWIVMVGCANAQSKAPVQTVDFVDVERYMGKWYEIAAFPQRFQKGCTATTAEYSLKKNGEVKVVNSCRLNTPDGPLKTGVARAWIVDRNTNAKLKVQFFLKRFKIPFFAGNYWIINLDQQDYSYAVVGDPSRKYLWILSRTPVMDENVYENLLVDIAAEGFDISKLVKTIR